MACLEQVLVRYVGESGEASVLVRKDERCAGDEVEWPSDADAGIVVADAAFGGGCVEVVAAIGEDGVVFEAEEAVGKAARDEELSLVLAGENFADPVAERWRGATQIHGDVEYGAGHDAHQLGLGGGAGLVVESAQDATHGARLVVLDKIGLDAGGGEIAAGPGFHEVSAAVAKDARLDDFHVWNGGGYDEHGGKGRGDMPRVWRKCMRGPRSCQRGFWQLRWQSGKCYSRADEREETNGIPCP